MLAVVLLYLAFVVIAPRIMENRPPMDLKQLILVYNFVLVIISGYMCFEVSLFYYQDSLAQFLANTDIVLTSSADEHCGGTGSH